MKNTLLMLIALLALTKPVPADETGAKLPDPDQIRAYYQQNAPSWPKIPRSVLLAFVAAEDQNFFEKPPQNSSLTSQIGNWFLLPGSGRLQNIALAFVIGEALSHDEIIDWYANQIFLGQTCFGVADAAMAYFGKTVEDLTTEEAAYLAALPKAPAHFHPIRSYDRALERRNFVLAEMQRAGFLSKTEAAQARQTDLFTKNPLGRC
jgi:membrane carboxypeptidase/penicillin-binding protein